MNTNKMTVAEKIAALKNIFNDFGIPVLPNSSLEQAIKDEFGRGKRSKLNQILLELHNDTDASKLALAIGAELKKNKDPQVLAVANTLQSQLPLLFGIIDMRHSIAQREQLLSKLLEHFHTKLPNNPNTDRMLRMIAAAQKNLSANLQTQYIATITENLGTAFNVEELKRFGKVFHEATPALIALNQADYPMEQKINHCINAIRALAIELRSKHLQMSADILDNIHWLAKVSLPQVPDQATIEQALQNLGISIGYTSTKLIQKKAAAAGLTNKEIIQLLYTNAEFTQMSNNANELLARTHENQQYAATCAYIAKVAYDVKQDDLARIAVAGVCLASLRQTYYEVKTDTLCAANFTESLGTILSSIGVVTKSDPLINIGNSIISGVITHSGIMSVPGGASIAVPLAVCTVLTKLFLGTRLNNKQDNKKSSNDILPNLLRQIVVWQQQIRIEFTNLYQKLYQLNQQVLSAIEQGFDSLENLIQQNHLQVMHGILSIENKLQDLQLNMQKEFIDLYLEYIHDPLEELDYINKYNCQDQIKIDQNKHKLVMWLLYKSKHPNVNGRKLPLENLLHICSKLNDKEGILSLVNKYVNLNFCQELPEDLPHISTWLLAANTYVWATAKYPSTTSNTETINILNDILEVGDKIVSFVEKLAENKLLWQKINESLQQEHSKLKARWAQLNPQFNSVYLQSFSNIKKTQKQPRIFAHPSPVAQIEPFTATKIDITELWNKHIVHNIPNECLTTVAHGLGSWHIVFTVDAHANNFHNEYIPYGDNILPDHSRDVLFKIEVYYKSQEEKLFLLTTNWFAYDLYNSRQRLEQYYRLKFKHGLRHTNYDWIRLDGRSNRVTGHGDTPTDKLIDYDRLATIYQAWLCNSRPINTPEILQRVQQNSIFVRQNAALLAQPNCTLLNTDNIALLKVALNQQLLTHMLQERARCAYILQQDPIMSGSLEKIDLYHSILDVYMSILNIDYTCEMRTITFRQLINELQNSNTCNEDLLTRFERLFTTNLCIPELRNQYLTGKFYMKIQTTLSKIKLLSANLSTDRPCLMARP